MNRVAVLTWCLAAALGCATGGGHASHLVGSGDVSSVNAKEQITIGGTVRSTAYRVDTLTVIGYAVRTTGTASGTWSIQYSNDYSPGVDDPTSDAKWGTYTLGTSPPAASGSPQTFPIPIDFYEFKYIRIKFTGSGGTGVATIVLQAKGPS